MSASSSSRGRSSSPFYHRKSPSSVYSSTSSSSPLVTGRLIPRSCSTTISPFYGTSNGFGSRSMTPSRNRTDSIQNGSISYGARSANGHASSDELIGEPVIETPRSGDSISVTIRFRPLSEREYQRGDDIAWYADGDKIVRSEHTPATAYAFDKVFGPSTASHDVYEVAGRPVVKAAMEGVNGTVFAYGVTSSGKTHTMHGDQNSPGIIPLAIKDVFSNIQDTPGREFLLRVSYIEIYNEVINDLLDPTGQNLRVREDAQGTYVEGIKEEVVLSPGHVLSFIAAGEEHRHVGSNNFNLLSSRSHTIFTLMIESSSPGDQYDGVIFSQLNLIDLAGSESSKTETTGIRRKEGSYINKSLLTLGTVIGKLSEGKASHVPYRDSKLTRLLQSSLGGHGHVSLICTVTPASSNMEETHNTLKFASRAKRVEIYASRNKIIDEKSLIKKYQREITTLKEELDQLRQGMLVGVSHEEILSLRQQLEEGQVKMQSRLEEEEEAKAALMSRIQRLTKLILVSTKSTIPGCLPETSSHQQIHSVGEEDKLDTLHDGSVVGESENQNDTLAAASMIRSDSSSDLKHRRSSSKWSDEISPASSIVEGAQVGEIISGLPTNRITESDEMDLLVEQVKMLAGEIALGTSTLKRLAEQSINDPDGSKTQIQSLERELQEKKRQMGVLEQRILESGEASIANASLVDIQQTVMRLMTQCNEKAFELEIKSADNRILQEQLQNKCSENKELQIKLDLLQQQLSSGNSEESSFSSGHYLPGDYPHDLDKKIHSQEIENEKLRLEHVQILEENSGLRVQNKKLVEETSYAKELASAAAVELKNLAAEITKISLQNTKLEKELTSREAAHSRASTIQNARRFGDIVKPGRRGRLAGRSVENSGTAHDDFESWNLDPDDLKMELQARKQREAFLEAALAEKEFLEDEYRRKIGESKKRETALENDLANMWVLVAQIKKEGERHLRDVKDGIENKDVTLQERLLLDVPREEPLVVRLKARMQEIKDKEMKCAGNIDTNSHVCKVCFESSTTAMLLPCRHFCLCKPCSLACSECPICRTKIVDRIFAFTS